MSLKVFFVLILVAEVNFSQLSSPPVSIENTYALQVMRNKAEMQELQQQVLYQKHTQKILVKINK